MEATDELVEVEVEFDYEAELGDELTIKAGEIIKDVKKMDGGWWEGSLNGRRGVFPDNFVKVLSKAQNSPKTKAKTVPSSTSTTTTTSASSEAVQLRRGQQSGRASANNKKKCRVLFSYQPKHDDELELKLDDVVEFLSEVEDGWWKGKLRGRVGVFPSNFVEMTKAAAASNTTTNTAEDDVADKNKRNEKLKVEKVQRPTSKISSLIQEAENKSKQRKSSTENLNLLKRESPLGGEDKKADDLVNAPKLPPKPGFLDPSSNDTNNNFKPRRPIDLPIPKIEVNKFNDEFEMEPLETMSPCDFLAPLKQDENVFFVGSLEDATDAGSKIDSKSNGLGGLRFGKIKRVLSAPKSLSTRRKSLSGIFRSTKKSKNPTENPDFESLSSSFNSLNFAPKPYGAPSRIRSISDNFPTITHPHDYEGTVKITRGSQTSSDLDLLGTSMTDSKKTIKGKKDVQTQTHELTRKVFGGRSRILTNPRSHP